jgi:hypothetical protein
MLGFHRMSRVRFTTEQLQRPNNLSIQSFSEKRFFFFFLKELNPFTQILPKSELRGI